MSDVDALIQRITFPAAYDLEHFDTSSWKLKDKDWVAQRKADWPIYEPVLKRWYGSKGTAVCKRYYMKGQVPDANAWRTTESAHCLTLFDLLWLHPSHDFDVLLEARNAYLNSDLVSLQAIQSGYNCLVDTLFVSATCRFPINGPIPFPDTRGFGELYFRVFMHHIDDNWYPFGGPNRNWLNQGFGSEFFSIRRNILFYKPKLDIYNIFPARDWLAMDDEEWDSLNRDYILQHDVGLEYFYHCLHNDNHYVTRILSRDHGRASLIKALVFLNDFDIEAETNLKKAALARKLCDLLDNRPWLPEIKNLWQNIREGSLELD